ncbi:endonuclease [Lottiidibacillus patelloidae]|uniref:Endonuclease n=1 Tax=Lottiidibacillus patelloidae TaxID=2670334 RepID=A0A263BQ31_9BACI|nr:GIY-YIG nuclease family protein [Lottiidibacillus patelloidae]OZM55861.1 endonuclease [Lottiidibacillus patelloidae]
MENNHYVYILECRDGTLYTGYTNNVQKRLQVHSSGKGAKYTRGRLPVTLIYEKQFTNKSEALKEEYKIKKLTKQQKLKLVKTRDAKVVDSEKLS